MHVTVCICTYRRPELLHRSLTALTRQRASPGVSFSIVVSDNDRAKSAFDTVKQFAARSAIRPVYCTEPQRNIALARNRALQFARGEYVAFIDDDELPAPQWLDMIVTCAEHFQSAVVLGPVKPYFDAPPPSWLIAGRFCERRDYPTGTPVPWRQCGAGNVLIRRSVLQHVPGPFRGSFGQGAEDVDLFNRLAAAGSTFIWCHEAVVYEVVPPRRWRRTYHLKRALLQGRISLCFSGRMTMLTSLLAVPAYLAAATVALAISQHLFMKYTIKLCGHIGRIAGSVNATIITDRPL